MIYQKLHKLIGTYVKLLQRFADRFWFLPLLALLAALDNFLIVIPNEGILISNSMVAPRRWFIFASSVAIGSTLGALVLLTLVEHQGLSSILKFYPGINETELWRLTFKFFEEYGLFLIFTIGLTPLSQQPAIILAGLGPTPFFKLAAIIFFSRLIKFIIMSYIASHAPRLLTKMWGIKSELKDAGVELEQEKPSKTLEIR